MCTLTILPGPDGPRIAMNRDEARSRAPESPPRLWETPRILAPVDGAAGGTWIGLRGDGVWAAVLNGYVGGDLEARGRRSRGGLVPALLAGDPFALDAAGPLEDFAGFRLLAGRGERVAEWFWDGRRLTETAPVVGAGLVRVSSGWRQEDVTAYREAAFARRADAPDDGPPAFHRWREPGREAWGVMMARDWSRTRSITEIRPGGLMRYWPVDEEGVPGPEHRRRITA